MDFSLHNEALAAVRLPKEARTARRQETGESLFYMASGTLKAWIGAFTAVAETRTALRAPPDVP